MRSLERSTCVFASRIGAAVYVTYRLAKRVTGDHERHHRFEIGTARARIVAAFRLERRRIAFEIDRLCNEAASVRVSWHSIAHRML